MKQHVLKFFRPAAVLILLAGYFFNDAPSVQAQIQYIPTAGVFINGKVVNGINPIKIDGVYYVPLVQLAKILGYNSIGFEEKTLTYELTDGSTKIRTTMGGYRAKKGNEYVNIKPPRWINKTAYISLHAAGALFNCYITFKPQNGSIQIQKPAEVYVVHTGDTLWNISRLHHVSVDALKRANGLTSHLIYDGQVLKLPGRDLAKEMEPAKEREPVKKKTSAGAAALRNQLLEEAKKYIGAGYKYGATLAEAPRLFDCSSYTQLVFKNVGIELPRVSRDQARKGRTVTQLEKGDLMFFTMKDSYSDGRVAHVGIYMGGGSMIHASTSKGVTITKNVLQNPYWSKNYLFSKRIIE